MKFTDLKIRMKDDIVRQVSQRYFQKESDIKAFGFCDIIFVPFSTAKAVYRVACHISHQRYIARAKHE
ncbi:MAG: hypothetical protein IJC46_03625, partial [Clostridia bacterium]|nr:hypothetical protein [Clostridia bacterium]